MRASSPTLRSSAATVLAKGLKYPLPESDNFFLPPVSLPTRSARDDVLDDLFEALALGLKDYYAKSGAFERFGKEAHRGTLQADGRVAPRFAIDLADDP